MARASTATANGSNEAIKKDFEKHAGRIRRDISALAESLSEAHVAFIGNVARIDQIPEDERLDIHQLSKDIQSTGALAEAIDDTDLIVRKITDVAQEGDIIAVLSNGGFDGIHEKLIEGLGGSV